MLRAYDFKCPEHGVFESYVTGRPDSIPCETCGQPSARRPCAPNVAFTYVSAKSDFGPDVTAKRRALQQRV